MTSTCKVLDVRQIWKNQVVNIIYRGFDKDEIVPRQEASMEFHDSSGCHKRVNACDLVGFDHLK